MTNLLSDLKSYLEQKLACPVYFIGSSDNYITKKSLADDLNTSSYSYYVQINSLEALAEGKYKISYKILQKIGDLNLPNLNLDLFRSGIALLSPKATIQKLSAHHNSFYCYVFDAIFFSSSNNLNYSLDTISLSFNNQKEEIVKWLM